MKRTKIVATIGPASESVPMIQKMVKAGMNVARLNFSHGTYEHHRMLINNLRLVSKKTGVPLAIIQDLQGPRIRLGEIKGAGLEVKSGQRVVLTPTKKTAVVKGAVAFIPIQYPNLYRDLKKGHPILIDDALIELKVTRISGRDVECQVMTGGLLKSHKGMNFPKSLISCPPLTKKDLADVAFGIKSGVDYVALSFVKDDRDILNLRNKIVALEKKSPRPGSGISRLLQRDQARQVGVRIIAKIERREAVKNFKKILAAADAIMVARGDLGIELPFEDLPLIQKRIIDDCRKAGKPVIVATQMLDSMIRNPLPTRAEVSDVANAILDGTDAIMLSGESASGKYPLQAVTAMSRIAREIEEREISEQEKKEGKYKDESLNKIMSFVAQDLAEDLAQVKLLVCATVSGFTARNISSFRPKPPVIAFTPAQLTVSQLALSWGINALELPFTNSFDQLLANIRKILLQKKLVRRGQAVIIVAGHPFGHKNRTNLVKVETL